MMSMRVLESTKEKWKHFMEKNFEKKKLNIFKKYICMILGSIGILVNSELDGMVHMLWIDEAVYLTSEKHDPCTQKVTYTKEENKNTLQKAPVWSRPNTLRKSS